MYGEKIIATDVPHRKRCSLFLPQEACQPQTARCPIVGSEQRFRLYTFSQALFARVFPKKKDSEGFLP
jgi:hypothetical protein